MKSRSENNVLDYRKNHKNHHKHGKNTPLGKNNEFLSGKNVVRKRGILQKYRDRISIFVNRFSKVEMQINGKNSAKALIAISKICKVENVKNGEDFLRFCLDGKHLSKIIALLQNLCYDYKIVNIGGMLPSVASVLSRVGILLGIAVFALCLSVYCAYIRSVDVKFIGVDNVALKAQVDGILQELGVHKGVKIASVDLENVQNTLLSLEDIAYAKVQKSGNRIVVELKNALGDDYVLDIGGSSVTAKKRAVVTRVVVEGGTSLKKYGDVVSIGDTIIDGYIEMGDDKISVEAKGYAYGIVYYSLSKFFPSEEVTTSQGEVTRVTRFGMFGKEPNVPQSPYESYTLKTSIKDFGFLLPLKVYTYEFCQVVQSIEPCTLSQDEMRASVYSSLLSEVENTAKIRDVHYTVAQCENGTTVQVLMEVEERIT